MVRGLQRPPGRAWRQHKRAGAAAQGSPGAAHSRVDRQPCLQQCIAPPTNHQTTSTSAHLPRPAPAPSSGGAAAAGSRRPAARCAARRPQRPARTAPGAGQVGGVRGWGAFKHQNQQAASPSSLANHQQLLTSPLAALSTRSTPPPPPPHPPTRPPTLPHLECLAHRCISQVHVNGSGHLRVHCHHLGTHQLFGVGRRLLERACRAEEGGCAAGWGGCGEVR